METIIDVLQAPVEKIDKPKKKSLFDYGEEFKRMESLLIECDGELTEEQEIEWQRIVDLAIEKIDNYIFFLSDLETKRDQYKNWADQYSKKHKTIDNKIKSLKNALAYYMEKTGQKEISGPESGKKVRLVYSEKAEMIEPNQIPVSYLRKFTTQKMSYEEMVKYLRVGGSLEIIETRVITDQDSLDEFIESLGCHIVKEKDFNLTDIKKNLKQGDVVPGAELVKNPSARIY